MKYKKNQKIHFMGIGGSGVSSLAEILKQKKMVISGCDQSLSPFTEKLIKDNVPISIGHDKKHIKDHDLIIYSPAIPHENEERREADRLKIPQLSYPQALGILTKEMETIAVCGTHGKTTTTALTYFAFQSSNNKPALIIGSTIPQLGNINGTLGDGKLLIMEACEYKRHFLELQPSTIVITNIDIDHLDYFKDKKDYLSSFVSFAMKLPPNGTLIANGDDKKVKLLIKRLEIRPDIKILTYGSSKSCNYRIEQNNIFLNNEIISSIDPAIPGQHNLMNSLAAFAVAHSYSLSPKKVKLDIEKFKGTGRRLELIGEYSGSIIYDDYGHHPTEILATLSALRQKYGKKKILCIFQPHQFSRTIKLHKEFMTAFTDADTLLLSDIYNARDTEKDKKTINSKKLSSDISKHHKSVIYGGTLLNTLHQARKIAHNYDIMITQGAGDIWEVSHQLANITQG